MKLNTRQTGNMGEDIAIHYLEEKGYRIIERNYSCAFGEIDIIARHRRDIVFTEVKTRRSGKFGDPAEAVDLVKQKKISKTALTYLTENNLHDQNARFDVVAVKVSPEGTTVELIENAFEFAY